MCTEHRAWRIYGAGSREYKNEIIQQNRNYITSVNAERMRKECEARRGTCSSYDTARSASSSTSSRTKGSSTCGRSADAVRVPWLVVPALLLLFLVVAVVAVEARAGIREAAALRGIR